MKKLIALLGLSLLAQSWTGSGGRTVGNVKMSKPWRLTYGCTSGSELIQAFVYQGDSIVDVTQSIDGVEQSTDIDKTGTFRIQINSTCRWKFTVAER